MRSLDTRISTLALTTLLAGVLTACDGGPTALPTSVDSGIRASTHANPVQGPRPLRGRLMGIASPGDPCSTAPAGIEVTAIADGVVSHLGATTLVQTACLSVPDFLPLGPSYASLEAADGSRLDGRVTALDFGPDGFDMVIAITGGTGRFAEPVGEYSVRVEQEAPLQPFTASIAGWVGY